MISTASRAAIMRAIRVHEFGGPEVLKLESKVPVPVPGSNQVLIKLMAAGVNPVDTYIRSGVYPRKPEIPYIPGGDGSGVLEQLGSDVKASGKWKIGDRVICVQAASGTYAEYCVANACSILPLSERLSFAQGAAIGVPYFTAYRALFQKCGASRGETALVHGASGAVGIAACQLAHARGIHVIGTAGSPDGLRIVKENGASEVFNHKNPHYTAKVLEVSPNQAGVDVIIEMLSNVNLGRDLHLLAPGGRVGVVGCRGTVEINPRDMMGKESSITGVQLARATSQEMQEAGQEIVKGQNEGWLRPVIDRSYPLEQASAAHKDIIESAGAKGKLVLAVASEC